MPGATPNIGRWLWAMEDTRRRTKAALADIAPPALDLQPFAGANSIGTLLFHIAAIELDWLYTDILEGNEPWPPELEVLFTIDVRDAQGQLSIMAGVSMAEHMQRLDIVRRHLIAIVGAMSLDEFRRERHLPSDSVTPEWVLHHLMQHEAEHRGQIEVMRSWAEQIPAAR
jgi:uncharacterized damage-inducible protein DinB